jgi:hypothetical protein
VGVVWAFVIANVDSMVVSLIGDRAGAARWTVIAPRLVMICLNGALFASLLVLHVFGPEVNERLARNAQRLDAQGRERVERTHADSVSTTSGGYGESIAHHEKALAALRATASSADDRTAAAAQKAVDAIRTRPLYYNQEGAPYLDPTHSRAAQAEEQRLAGAADRLRGELAPELERERREIDRLRAEQAKEQARVDRQRDNDLAALAAIPSSPGLVARLSAMAELCAENPSAWLFRLLLGALLFSVELTPMAAKLAERADAAWIRERLHRLLRDALESQELKARMQLLMEASSFRYVRSYMDGVDAGMDVARPTQPADEAAAESRVRPAEARGGDADERVRRIIELRSQANGHSDHS